MPIWSDDFLNQLALDAEQEIVKDVDCLYKRFCLAITKGVSVYQLPDYVRSIRSVSWRGRKLDPASWEELQLLSPATAIVAEGSGPTYPQTGIETSVSRPLWYALHPTNVHSIRLYPCPDETFVDTGFDPYAQAVNEANCIVACWRNVDSTFQDPTALLPKYIDRRTRKAFILWRAFEKDGKGQVAAAAQFYKAKYDYLTQNFRMINEQAFIGKRYNIDDGVLTVDQFRYPKPILPSNFERFFY